MSEQQAVNMIQAINMALTDSMEQDDAVIVLGEDVADPEGGGIVGITKGLSDRYGEERVLSTPISEQAIVGAAIGASLAGMKPVAEIMLMNFTTVAMDMIVNHAAKLRFMSGGQTNVPITIRTMTGAGFGSGGQHCDYFESWFAHVAGMKVVAPSNPADAYGLMLSCIDDPDPCLFIENLPSYFIPGAAPTRGEKIPLGKANVALPGTQVTLVSYSRQVADCLAVAGKLAEEGISVEVIDLRTIAPLDIDTIIQSVEKTKRLVVVHEANKTCGIGAEISALVQEQLHGTLAAPIKRVTAASCPVPFSKPLEDAYLPSQNEIESTIKAII